MTESLTAAPKVSRWRRIRPFVLLAVLVLLVVYVGLDLWAEHRLNQAVVRFEQRFGTLSPHALTTEAVPAADNRARLVRAAAALGVAPSTNTLTLLARFGTFQEPPSAELLQFVEDNQRALNLLAEIGSRHRASWEADYADSDNMPPWLDVVRLSQAAQMAAFVEIQAKHPEEASRTIASGLAISASIRQEPQLLAQLVRNSIAYRQFDALRRLIDKTEPSKAALEDLAYWLNENREPDSMVLGLLSEARLFHWKLIQMEAGRRPSPADSPVPLWAGPISRIARPFLRLGHANYLVTLGAMLDAQMGPRPRPAVTLPTSFLTRWTVGASFAGLSRSAETGDDFISELGAAEIVVALCRFKIDRGLYPEDLSALVPAYLQALPLNRLTGKIPVYLRTENGFKLSAPLLRYVGISKLTPDWIVAK